MKTFYILFLLSICTFVNAQTASIKGKIITENTPEFLYATVQLKELNKTIHVDKNGNYEIKNLQTGNYTLVFSALGYINEERKVELNENKNINVILKENVNALQTVEITGRKEKSYKNTRSFI
ncbi:carboxypeptidase-like regulatory domain-containing protein [Flavobacterium nitratireducens]|uniref:carboxypeptidase-like regulatory domain-containing protein n=1 Tax=Flavobacterium nitratireducens TaxID=992289 RepID=UPI00241562A4|nr:carboxypeptidase-like regulatory domain-containing protein [Flavobacterium nitratireducens]